MAMKLQVARWGNSLAIRLPVECVRAVGLQEGDSIQASVTAAGDITLTPDKAFDKSGFLRRLANLQTATSMTDAVVERMRGESRY